MKINQLLLSTNEVNFILDAIKQNIRIDGRSTYDYRKLNITFGKQNGQALVHLGSTKVLATITAEIVEPYEDRPSEGNFLFNVEFSTMADPTFEAGRPSEYAIEVARVVERTLRESRAIDNEALCIISGQKVWSIRCDITVIDNDGNLIDCASIATVVALHHFRKPATSLQDNSVIVYSPEEREPVPLAIHHMPICVSFAFFHDGDRLVVDPQLKEEIVMDGRITIAVNSHREVCAVQKAGGCAISVDQVVTCSRIAAVKVEEIIQQINAALRNNIPQKYSSQSSISTQTLKKSIPNQQQQQTTKQTQTPQKKDSTKADFQKELEMFVVDDFEMQQPQTTKTQQTQQTQQQTQSKPVEIITLDDEDEKPTQPTKAQTQTPAQKKQTPNREPDIILSDSEEEEQTILMPETNTTKPKQQTQQTPKTNSSVSKQTTSKPAPKQGKDVLDLSSALKKKSPKK